MLSMAAGAQAETAYGLMSGYPSWNVCSYDFAQLGNVKATKLFAVPFSDVQSAASLGECYYTYAVVTDYDTYMDNLYFASVNMQSQETTLLNNFGDAWAAFIMRDMTSCGGELYGIVDNNVWNDETDEMVYGSKLVKINTTDGTYEAVAEFNTILWGITTQNEELYAVVRSGMKGWSYLVDLCKVNADYTLTQLTSNTEVASQELTTMHAVAAEDGFYFFGSKPIKFNLADGTATLIEGTTLASQYTGTTFTASTKDAETSEVPAEEAATRMLVSVSSYGDFMGTAKDTQLTAQRLYFYNQNLQVVAVVETAANLGGEELYTQYYNPYIYNEAGQLITKDRYQYGLYDMGDRAMHQVAGVVSYEYDAAGNCVKEIEDQNTVTYEYDENGNCVKEVRYTNDKAGKTIVYSDFAAGKNKPALVSASHSNASFTGEFYDESREYDAQGRLVKAVRICNRDYVEDHGIWQITTAYGDFMQEEHWTYEGKQLALYEKFTSLDEETGELMPYLKTVYTVKDENTVGYQSYTAFGNEWYKSGVYQEETYCEFAGMTDVTAVELVSVAKSVEGINNAEVEFTVPQIAYFNSNVAFSIYRNGELIRTLSLMDAFDEESGLAINEENGNLIFTDRDVKSGVYDYFVQVMTISGDQMGPEPLADDVDPGFNVEPLVYTGYCTSNIVKVDLTLELPAATNVMAVENTVDENQLNHVGVMFTLPAEAADYGFISNEIVIGNAQVAEESSTSVNINENKLYCIIGDDTAYIRILTRYIYGHALSESTLIDVNNLSTPTTISELNEQIKGEKMVFDMSGRQVSAPLESLHGNYIIVSGNTAYKVVLK